MRARKATQPGSRLGMPVAAWPAEDQKALHEALTAGGRFGRKSMLAQFRQPTRDALVTCYARWLAWLRDHHPEALLRSITDRTTKDAVTDYLRYLDGEVTPKAVADYAARLVLALKLMASRQDWSWFAPIIRELNCHAADATPTKRRPFIHTAELDRFGIELMNKALAATGLSDIERAERFRDGLVIAFLATRPLRHKNLAQLEIGMHLKAVGEGFFVTLPKEIMKQGPSLEFPLPVHLAPFMRTYLDVHRPILAARQSEDSRADAESTALWLGRTGEPVSYDTLGDRITARVEEQFNKRLTPHDFRHCAATTIAENNPEDFMCIRLILGHSTLATSEKYYIHAKAIEAARRFQATVASKRKSLAFELRDKAE
jgi:integrase/recombinase XerD